MPIRCREFSTTPHARFQPSITSYDAPPTTTSTTTTTTPSSTNLSQAEDQDPLAEIQLEDLRSRALQESAGAPLIETDLVLPPEDLTVAPRPDELTVGKSATASSPSEAAYTPADDATRLEVVGGLADWFSPKHNNWSASKSYVGFGSSVRVNNPALLQVCARRAVLEALAAVQGGRAEELLTAAWSQETGREALLRVLELKVQVDEQGQATVEGDVSAVVESLSGEAPAVSTAAAQEGLGITAEEARRMRKAWDSSWTSISLEDVKVKFAITKRVFQLTGHAIADAKLVHVNTVGQLLDVLVKPEPARSVNKAIEHKGELTKLRNVEVFAKRRTPVHEAKRVGRWKVIEKELEKRGLPVFGHGGVDKYREREWLRGPMPAEKDRKRRR
ncbi:ribosomal subunit 39S-domain-containing protein [Coniella lustricola]|uniref:Large ribosomal subunit protein mL50 n=1 Tax=Coniella lustricola TaxID=2025994 RepID=A0A2T3A705_9PEZI|nr:ribosomal subunit 39S-domain-containing protein [Coniella lustricola]